jgi:hypothetical protein
MAAPVKTVLNVVARYELPQGWKSPFNQDDDKNSGKDGWRERLRRWWRRLRGRK